MKYIPSKVEKKEQWWFNTHVHRLLRLQRSLYAKTKSIFIDADKEEAIGKSQNAKTKTHTVMEKFLHDYKEKILGETLMKKTKVFW